MAKPTAVRCLWMLPLLSQLSPGTGFECGTPPEVRKFLRTSIEKSELQTHAERKREVAGWISRYPRVFELRDYYLRMLRFREWEKWPALRAQMVQEAEARPDDAIALTVAAAALRGSDTPRAIALLERAQTVQPGDPISALELSRIYLTGKFADKEKSRQYFEVYAKGCPGYVDRSVEQVMSKAAPLETQTRMAEALRQRLEKSTEPEEVSLYPILWGLEFRTRLPAEHPALRKQVAADLVRLKKTFPAPDARILAVLKTGAKQAGAAKEELALYDARIQQLAPRSQEAYVLARQAWEAQHKEPDKHDDVAGWMAWKKAYFEALTDWKDRYTEVRWLRSSWLALGAELKLLREEQVIPQLAKRIEDKERNQSQYLWDYLEAARVVLDNQWDAGRALGWMEKAWREAVRLDQYELNDDTVSEEERQLRLDSGGYRALAAAGWLRAALVTGERKAPPDMRAFIERPTPAGASWLAGYYESRARLAAIEGRRADALTYFQQALLARREPPRMYRGKLEDRLLEDAKAYFLANGGSEAAFALWATPRPGKAGEPPEGRWETPTKPLPAFELTDLSGQTWTLKQLEGKALLINLWATWCGPCRAELPYVQKLYEQTKDRADVQVLTFNIDEEVGLVEPYMREHGFTFPVLLAYQLVHGFLGPIGIPQNWLVDPKGNWKATQVGFDAADPDWVNTMLRKLESLRTGQ
jgi:thiol-disulfide isomerase/thioredoxin